MDYRPVQEMNTRSREIGQRAPLCSLSQYPQIERAAHLRRVGIRSGYVAVARDAAFGEVFAVTVSS